MKKLMFLAISAIVLAGCMGNVKTEENDLQRQLDSLRSVNMEQAAELEECMTLIDQVNEGFRIIKESEGQFDIANGDLESGQRDQMVSNMQFVQDKLKENRELIDMLKKKVNSSSNKLASLVKQVEKLEADYQAQVELIRQMEQQMAERDMVIAQQSELIDDLEQSVSQLEEENEQRTAEIAAQEKELNKAWFAIGTKKELKEFKILDGGEVLQNSNYNRNYFTEIDIRYVNEIQLHAKSASLLTTHPSGSYELKKNANGQYDLYITNAQQFWSVSRYLVVQVK